MQYLTISDFRPGPPSTTNPHYKGISFLHDSILSISIFAWLTPLKLDDLELEVDLTRARSAEYNFSDFEELYLDKIAPEAVHESFWISFFPNLISLDIMGCIGVDANVLDHWHYDSVVRTLTISPKTLIGGISVALVFLGWFDSYRSRYQLR